jgi:YD repeat-containing protein
MRASLFLDRVTAETNDLSKTRTFKYDAVNNLLERVDRLGRKTVWEYGGTGTRTPTRSGTTEPRLCARWGLLTGPMKTLTRPSATLSQRERDCRSRAAWTGDFLLAERADHMDAAAKRQAAGVGCRAGPMKTLTRPAATLSQRERDCRSRAAWTAEFPLAERADHIERADHADRADYVGVPRNRSGVLGCVIPPAGAAA